MEEILPASADQDDELLFWTALAVEQDEELAAEMAEWEAAMIGDALDQLL
jgi:hypothetical protein